MKKIIFLIFILAAVSSTFGQSKWHEKQNNHFVAQAAKEYSLTEDQQEDLRQNRMEMVTAFISSNEKMKAGEITSEERKEITKEASKTFNSYFSQLAGKPYAEVAPFLKRMREELKNLK
ncbi:hypothetical protein H7U19_12395 [Hyunsoonleella sp. SJ7]|uniref:DUF4890 domain-containing protein n=1 Tax=Hyunsoonleella aquatilis TaxID=2762758 RepID=A0A923HJ01_9FLAO|nr:hypothetical protein [Hyunsoonleella aquatilis]MBC3759212.1 hypothetical protein [Hyunsoonleella aquatilis]